ncbi:sulfurtransferase [Salinisphaera sp. T31B1]|uniref:sulfurtransferase n=1 Tax=Salinisphaera sp. T31B1 TaxID=727963 RepID=UPI003341BCEE
MSDSLPLFISADQLAEVAGAPNVQIVAVDAPADFASAHVPGARQLSMADFTVARPPVAGLLPMASVLEERLRKAGLRHDMHIVAYDRVGDGQAARLLYTLDAMGHASISLLDGGLAAWHHAGQPLEGGAVSPAPGDFRAQPQSMRIADKAWIAARLDDDDITLLDVRSPAEYAGTDVRSARGGHIPGAINLDWNRFKGPDGRLRPRAELKALLKAEGIDADQDVVNYCQSHVRSSYTYLVLRYLGYERVRGYPGAWSDWGNSADTPVVSGADPYGASTL